ncbi:Nif11-like leader peptide family natural product precursor [Scytonema sp. UIC 10036]|uniref:Nif11-like leader peptide family RiPP precursor n=1 Tax=Scytonema sp. UIC 10036 TaxID=2304196 RepID=UPI0012DA8496|nr:Nif11-like leader peptide family RiPP precursor [Scytonema sp. UIC 10036]MUG97847.1 Nif11-like leader peptide family natural product precursor [Scytonema sp. UIC 10036]
MSIESAKSFYSRVAVDDAFRSQLEQSLTQEERKQILKASGYQFTADEWQVVIDELQACNSDADALQDEDLEAIAGGVTYQLMYGVIRPTDIFEWLK